MEEGACSESTMSVSPPIRRLSTNSSSREDLIYQYEAEEERIINILSRKLEQVSAILSNRLPRILSSSALSCEKRR